MFIATGASLFPGSVAGTGSELRINSVLHVNSKLSPGTIVPIGWIAAGDPAGAYKPISTFLTPSTVCREVRRCARSWLDKPSSTARIETTRSLIVNGAVGSQPSLAFQQGLERGQILPICPAHGYRHHWRGDACEAGRGSPVAEGHMGPLIRKVAPCVGRLHWERPFGRSHDQPLIRDEVDHLVGVRESAAQEARDKCEAGTDVQWLLGLSRDTLDVGVPVRSVIRIGGISSYHLTWSGDIDGGRNVDWRHEFTKTGAATPVSR